MKPLIIGSIVFCVALIGGGILLSRNTSTQGPRIVPLHQDAIAREKSGVWARGVSENPKVTLEEYADFQCPGCGAMYPILEETLAATSDIVQFQYHQFPLRSHNKAKLASIGSEAAGRQGKFWQMHSLIFSNQLEWRDLLPSAFRDTLVAYAESLSLNVEQFKRDLDDGAIADMVDDSYNKGIQRGVDSTPTIYLNGKELSPVPNTPEQFIAVIREAAGLPAATEAPSATPAP